MQISSMGFQLNFSAGNLSANKAVSLVNELSDKTLYLTDEKEFDDAIQKEIQLSKGDGETEAEQNGIQHKTGDLLNWTLGVYDNIIGNLNYAKQELLQGTLGKRQIDLSQTMPNSPNNVAAAANSEEPIDSTGNATVILPPSDDSDKTPYTWEDYQKDFCNEIDFLGGLGGLNCTFGTSLYSGYLADGAQVTDEITNQVKQTAPNGQDDWLNVSAHSLGLDQTFASEQDFMSAIDNAVDVVKSYTDAISSVMKSLPSTDWYRGWGMLDTRA